MAAVKFSKMTARNKCPACCLSQGTLHCVAKSTQLLLKDRKASNDHLMANKDTNSSRSIRGSLRACFGQHAFLPFFMSAIAEQPCRFDFAFLISSQSRTSCERVFSLPFRLQKATLNTVWRVTAPLKTCASPAMQCLHTHMLLTAFCCKNFAITIFTWDLFEWRRSSFFCCLIEVGDFQGAAILSSVCRSLLSFKAKKWDETWTLTSADDLTLQAKPLDWVPVISSPKPFLDQL